MTELQTIVAAVLGGGGAGIGAGIATAKIIIKDLAKEALKDDLIELKAEDRLLHGRVNKVESETVSCKYCDTQHKNLDNSVKDIREDIRSQGETLNEIYKLLIKADK